MAHSVVRYGLSGGQVPGFAYPVKMRLCSRTMPHMVWWMLLPRRLVVAQDFQVWRAKTCSTRGPHLFMTGLVACLQSGEFLALARGCGMTSPVPGYPPSLIVVMFPTVASTLDSVRGVVRCRYFTIAVSVGYVIRTDRSDVIRYCRHVRCRVVGGWCGGAVADQ